MKTRHATSDDIPTITKIYARSVIEEHASFELTPPNDAEMLGRMNELQNAGYPYLVAEDDAGIVVGYAYVSAYRPRPAYASTVENTVYVSKSHWGQGIARALMNALVSACREKQFKQMIGVISCEPDQDISDIPSAALHLLFGFKKTGRMKKVGCKHNKWLDVLLMQKEL